MADQAAPDPAPAHDAAPDQPAPRRMPILIRHAISLAVLFVIALPASYFIGQRVYRGIQLDKLQHADKDVFRVGLGYVLKHGADKQAVHDAAMDAVANLPADRAGDVLLNLATSYKRAERPPPKDLTEAIGPLMQRSSVDHVYALYRSLYELNSIDPAELARLFLTSFTAEEDADFLRAVELADVALIWNKDLVPRDRWIRWAVLMAKQPSETDQQSAARLLGELPEDLADPRIGQALTALSKSPHASVRAQVLRACAGYAAIAKNPLAYEQAIFALGQDKDPEIARSAWLVVGHLRPLSGFAVKWQSAEPEVAQAMLWAAMRTDPTRPKRVLEALASPKHAEYPAFALSRADDVDYRLLQKTGVFKHALTLDDDRGNLLSVWRTLLALKHPEQDAEPWQRYLRANLDADAQPESAFALSLASIYRQARLDLPDEFTWTDEDRALGQLAAVEGALLDRDKRPQTPPTADAPLAALVAAATGLIPRTPTPDDFAAGLLTPKTFALTVLAFVNGEQPLTGERMAEYDDEAQLAFAFAAAIAGKRPMLISGVSAELLRKRPDLTNAELHKMTDAELAKLGLKRVDAIKALLKIAEAAPRWDPQTRRKMLLQLALWTRGDLDDSFTAKAVGMLSTPALPKPVVLLCLLYKQHPAALRHLFDTEAGQRDLYGLLIQQRGWHAVRHTTDTSDIPLWLWGDPAMQDLQFESMRQWYAVNRWRLERGWWPIPKRKAQD